jgi:hypothetical protein
VIVPILRLLIALSDHKLYVDWIHIVERDQIIQRRKGRALNQRSR